jgi:hypothetical protein
MNVAGTSALWHRPVSCQVSYCPSLGFASRKAFPTRTRASSDVGTPIVLAICDATNSLIGIRQPWSLSRNFTLYNAPSLHWTYRERDPPIRSGESIIFSARTCLMITPSGTEIAPYYFTSTPRPSKRYRWRYNASSMNPHPAPHVLGSTNGSASIMPSERCSASNLRRFSARKSAWRS